MIKILLIGLLSLAISPAHSLTIHCGNMLDVTSGKMLTNMYIEMKNGLFSKVEKYNNQSVDLEMKNRYCLPGLIDMHTHLSHEYNKNSYVEKFQLNESYYALKSTLFAKRT